MIVDARRSWPRDAPSRAKPKLIMPASSGTSTLATTLGPERFLREIQISARLHHPHILPLYDSGEAQGFLYYVMPLVEGESLRDRLTREKQLNRPGFTGDTFM